jgi:hypothetical protein
MDNNNTMLVGLVLFVLCFSLYWRVPEIAIAQSILTGYNNYTNSTDGYSIQYPSGWSVNETYGYGIPIYKIDSYGTHFVAPGHALWPLSVTVGIDRNSSDSLAPMFSNISGFPAFHIIQNQNITSYLLTSTGNPANVMTVVSDASVGGTEGGRISYMAFSIKTDDIIYRITLMSTLDQLTEYVPVYDKMESTFKLLNTTDTAPENSS